MAVKKEAEIVFEACQDEVLVASVAREDDLVRVNVVFGGGGDVPGFGNAGPQSTKDRYASDAQAASARELAREKKRAPERDSSINQTKKHGGADEAEARHKQNWEQKRSSQRAKIIEGEDVGDD